jgi:hypothetical protein
MDDLSRLIDAGAKIGVPDRSGFDQIDVTAKKLFQGLGQPKNRRKAGSPLPGSKSTRKSASLRAGSKSVPRAAEPNTSSRRTA